MAVKSLDELLSGLRAKMGEAPSDEDLALLEDVSDTFKDASAKTEDKENWKEKFEKNDAEWRKRYSDRFLGKDVPDPDPLPDPSVEDRASSLTIDDLFTKGE